MDRSKITKWLVPVLVSIGLIAVFSWVFFDHHAWGAWGDDSPGYIYLAARMYQGLPLVYIDELAKQGLDFFGDEKLARWLIPTHHQFINSNGSLASEYPLGLSLMMLAVAKLTGSFGNIYFVVPLCAIGVVVFSFLLCWLLFDKHRFRYWIACFSALLIGSGNLFYSYAIAQPMRDIPALSFLLLTAVLLVWVSKIKVKKYKYIALIFCGLAFGMAVNVRETSLVVAPAFLVYYFGTWQIFNKKKLKQNVKKAFAHSVVVFVGFFMALLPVIPNAINISQEKEVFKKRDVSTAVVVPNIDHVQSLSFEHIFISEGKFNPGNGALPHYWEIMQSVTEIPFFFFLMVVGVIFIWRESKAKMLLLGLWWVGVLLLFSMWINPYSRYIISLIPPLVILVVYGFFSVMNIVIEFVQKWKLVYWFMYIGLVCVLGFWLLPNIQQIIYHNQVDLMTHKSITKDDLRYLEDLGEKINSDDSVLMFSGTWQYGTSETFESHSGVKTIRFPFEQKFSFDQKQVYDFLDNMVFEKDLYVWIDASSSAAVYSWLKQYQQETVAVYDFSYQPWVRVIKVTPNTVEK